MDIVIFRAKFRTISIRFVLAEEHFVVVMRCCITSCMLIILLTTTDADVWAWMMDLLAMLECTVAGWDFGLRRCGSVKVQIKRGNVCTVSLYRRH